MRPKKRQTESLKARSTSKVDAEAREEAKKLLPNSRRK